MARTRANFFCCAACRSRKAIRGIRTSFHRKPACRSRNRVSKSALLSGRRDALADFGAKLVDRGELVLALDVPVGPAVAGFRPLRQRAEAMDRADIAADLQRTVGAH